MLAGEVFGIKIEITNIATEDDLKVAETNIHKLLENRLRLRKDRNNNLTYDQEKMYGDLLSELERRRFVLMSFKRANSTHMMVVGETEDDLLQLKLMLEEGRLQAIIEKLYSSIAALDIKVRISVDDCFAVQIGKAIQNIPLRDGYTVLLSDYNRHCAKLMVLSNALTCEQERSANSRLA